MTPMTVAEYRAQYGTQAVTPARKRTTRRALPRAGARSRCVTCGIEFTSDAAETAHVRAGHTRYETITDEP